MSSDLVPVTVLWAPLLSRSVDAQCARLGKSPSWLVETAWRLAKGNLSATDDSVTMDIGGPKRVEIQLPADVYAEIEARAQAERCSVAWIIQRTVTYAWAQLDALKP